MFAGTNCNLKGVNVEKPKASPVVGVVLLLLSLLLVVGLLSFAGPCGVHDDGSVSSCFWASRAMLGMGVVLAIISVVRIFETDEGERRGLSLCAALVGALVAAVPGGLIDLCMMTTMRCHTIMRPFALCVGIAIAVVGGVDLVRRLLAIRKR
ncbi:MAG TPA: hypothetical protein DCP91_02445 [Eggerthellaceae bacterium]|nr:hypothetical protein [Eggerthellaceae bacterium]